MFEFSNARQVAARRRARRHASRSTRLFLESLEDRRLLASDPLVRLIDTGDVWKYLDDGSDQGTDWQTIAFDDSLWASGPSELGYGDGDEATMVGYGSDPLAKYATTYFRRKFQVDNPSQINTLTTTIRRDDAVAVYLNGQEADRDNNLPFGASFSTYATSGVADEAAYFNFSVDPALLVPGENTIAVEVHQVLPDSSDISLDVRMVAVRTARFTVTNTANSGPGSLRQAVLDCGSTSGTPHTIEFDIPGGGVQQIVLASVLSNLSDAVTYKIPAGTEIRIGTTAPNAISLGQCLKGMSKTGDGTLTIGGNFTRIVNTALNVNAGTVVLLTDPGVRTTPNVNSGALLLLGSNQTLAALNVNADGRAQMLPGARVMVTNALTVNATGQFDIGDNDVIVQATLATRNTVFNNVTSWVATGVAGLHWNGNGVMSSSAAADPNLLTAIGVMLNDNGQGGAFYTSFSGKTVGVNSILLKYTYYGDADLSGLVDGTDYALTDNGFNAVLSGWFNGNFDYSAPIGGTDYALIDNSFNAHGTPLSAADEIPGVPAVTPPSQQPNASDRPIGSTPAALAAAMGDWTFAVDDGFGLPTRRRR